MQNPAFLKMCLDELEHYAPLDIIKGDEYHPVLAIRINDFELPDTILERTADIIIPMPRCAGFIPDASIAGMHISCVLHGEFCGEPTVIPFCDPVHDVDWMLKTQRFYPYYERDPHSLVGTSYLCLNDPSTQPETPLALIEVAMDYLYHWTEHAFNLASHHGAVARGSIAGDRKVSADWVGHLVEHVSPKLKKHLLSLANPGFGG